MRVRAILLAAALMLAPLSARAADLVIWWEGGLSTQDEQVLGEVVASFEQKTGKDVELIFYSPSELIDKAPIAVETGKPPDFLFGSSTVRDFYYSIRAHEGRLIDISDTIEPWIDQFDSDAVKRGQWIDPADGQIRLYGLPIGRSTNHIHVWRKLLEQAGFTLNDIPEHWEPFWAFWCDKVQPTVRKVLGRDDIWAIGLPMSVGNPDTRTNFWQFVEAYDAHYVTRDGRLIIDEPQVQSRLIKVVESYITLWRKGCTPPDSIAWDAAGNNKAFLGQRVIMTMNTTLSIPNAVKATRPEDYDKNVTTIDWPSSVSGQPLAIVSRVFHGMVLRDGGHATAAKEFVRFLVGEDWLEHWLYTAGDRILPPIPALLDQPFWLDTGDPHRLRSAVQFLTRPHDYAYSTVSGNWRHELEAAENVWGKVIHRVAAEGASPEQAVVEAIARVKQLLSE
jgi:multiple sugar transport system substrate-binding protein